MRGFGAVPKRGAEVGGILLGSATTRDGGLVIAIEDYEMAPIEYKRGPSYQLSPADLESFEAILDRARARSSPELRLVGFFRSHTREAPGLVDEDLEFLDRFFPDPDAVVLLIRPYATRVSTATFLVRENGHFRTGAPAGEFPFRRKDLAPGDDTPPNTGPAQHEAGDLVRGSSGPPANGSPLVRYDEPGLGPAYSGSGTTDFLEAEDPLKNTGHSGWVWVPLSFIFLLLGVLLGFQAALTLRPQTVAGSSDPFDLQLNVSKEGENLNVRWDRQSRAIRTATGGVLVIVDGLYNKTVELDPNQLQTGTVVYRHNSGQVRFRLEVYPSARDMLIETVDWKQ